jgi:aspartyl-tRNA synthetase
MSQMRTHNCGELTKKDADNEVTLCGWMHSRRDHGGVIFVDLRDKFGKTQITFNPEFTDFKNAEYLRREDVLQITGIVKARGEGLVNPNLATGEIEVIASKLTVLNKSETPPIEIDDNKVAGEEARLKYRYLDLRRPDMQNKLAFRHKVTSAGRRYFDKHNFVEVDTPLLVKSTPEGARDYVVPSRVNKGQFYALPQSPQLYKQLLMIAGTDRYYQVAKCLRDEDLRADRQPEHTQFDFEMSFVTQDDIRTFVEGLFANMVEEAQGIKVSTPFPTFSYAESMDKYGTDKPDIRYELFVSDVSDIVKDADFGVFTSIVENGGKVLGLAPEKTFGRKELDNYISFAQQNGAKGLAWMRVTEEGTLDSNIAKYFNDDIKAKLVEKMGAKPNSTVMFIADKKDAAFTVIDKLRRQLAEDLDLYDKKELAFCWVNNFPLFAWSEEDKRWQPEHHIFSMPNAEFLDTMEKDPAPVTGDLWDLALNGVELGSGSIRVSDPKIQQKLFNIIGMTDEEAQHKFGFLLEAYKYGGPIHGGMGLGVDRFVAMLLGSHDIREVIAFPKNKSAECPMDGSPGVIEEAQLKDLGLEIVKKKA